MVPHPLLGVADTGERQAPLVATGHKNPPTPSRDVGGGLLQLEPEERESVGLGRVLRGAKPHLGCDHGSAELDELALSMNRLAEFALAA